MERIITLSEAEHNTVQELVFVEHDTLSRQLRESLAGNSPQDEIDELNQFLAVLDRLIEKLG